MKQRSRKVKYLTVLILTILIALGSLPVRVLAQDETHDTDTVLEAQNIELIRRLIDGLWNGNDIEIVDVVYHSPHFPCL